MARIRAKETTLQEDSLATSIEVGLPEHQANDLLVICIARDNNREDFSTPSGWTKMASIGFGPTGNTTNAVRGAVYWKVASSSSETNPTFTIVNSDEMLATALSIEGVNTSTPVDITPITGTDNSTPVVALPSVTTATNNALVFHFAASDSAALPHPPASWVTVDMSFSGGAVSTTLIMTVQQTAGAVDATEFITNNSTADESAIISFAIRDGSSGTILPPYPKLGSASIIDPLRATGTSLPDNYFSNTLIDIGSLWKFGQSITTENPTSCWQVDASPLTYTSMLTQATNDTQSDVVPFPATEAIGDFFTVGYSSTFGGILIDRTGATNGAGGIVEYEYWNGSTWAALTERCDMTAPSANRFATLSTLGAQQFIRWKIPTDWATVSLNGETADYKIRIRCTTVYTTNPTLTRIRVLPGANKWLCDSAATPLAANAGLNFNESALTVQSRGLVNTTKVFSALLLDPAATLNWSSGLVALCFGVGGGPYLKSIGSKSIGGMQFGVYDRTNDRILSWCIASSDSDDTSAIDLQTVVVQPSQSTDTSWQKSATPPSVSNVDSFFIAGMSNSAGIRNNFFTRVIYIPSTIQICGGGSSSPITWEELISGTNFYEFPIINKTSGICIAPLQFGGTNRVYLDATIFSLSFPAQASKTNDFTKCHVDEGYLGVVVDARAGDVVKMRSGSIIGNSKIRFEMLETCSASATYAFNGLTVVNANVTLRPVATFSAMAFINCTTFAQNQADLSRCSFSGSTIACDKLAGISDCSFTCTAEHAIVLGASQIGSHVFTGNSFSGYGADGSDTAAIYNNSGGLVTIQLSAGDSVPTVKNGTGASTVVALAAAYTISNIVAGSRLLIRRTDTQSVLVNEIVSGTSKVYTYNYVSDFPVEVILRKASSAPYYQEWKTTATLISTNASVTANQLTDE